MKPHSARARKHELCPGPRTGRPDEFVKKVAQSVAQNRALQKLIHDLSRGKKIAPPHSGQNCLFERKNSKIPNATFLSYLVLILFSIEYKPLCYYFFTCILFFLAKNDFFLLHQK
jgi:hypothetical protein